MLGPHGTIVVTGANGFVGRAVVAQLQRSGRQLLPLSRRPAPGCTLGPPLAATSDWRSLLVDCDTVIHCAARVHQMQDDCQNPLAAYRAENTSATLALAHQAAAAGVRRFIFLSTIKVHGETTAPGHAFSADSPLVAQDPYARSKAEAESALRELAAQTRLEVVIIRPPLVYGPGVKANFARLSAAVARGWPLPLGALRDNRRSLLALANLADLICHCVDHPAAANRAFVACDGEDLSTAELLRRLARAHGRPARLLSLPLPLLQWLAQLGGKQSTLARLSDNLQVDMSQTCRDLGWQPPLSVDAGLLQSVTGTSQP